ncbi:MAG: redox-sensing transcriptional repressor Rex [Anaerolineaceae bacterium]|nr:redox-sensing transcriptional repressor Rex [Anaerolineaceae bacterium]MDD4042076.1 redox-sensing transcriptional repressor Rex [Anaerolineaceae bacterium]MDD4578099.1 redox-sensing transcriptional repressor Rex [Anaerolineaceae bacterium]
MKKEDVPEIVVSRLPLYVQTLNQLLREGQSVVSSSELGERLKTTPSQIRRDLSYFGDFGKQGTGYEIILLMESLRRILNLNQIWQVVLVGVGHVGEALLNYDGFSRKGFEIIMAFDQSPKVIGKRFGTLAVKSVDELEAELSKRQVDIGAISVPAENAQEVCDRLVNSGVRAILNYAPIALEVPEGVQLATIDPVVKLQKMTYYLK